MRGRSLTGYAGMRSALQHASAHARRAAARLVDLSIGRVGRWVARFNAESARVAFTSGEIARRVADREARGQTLRDGFFGGPGTEGDAIASFALLAAEHVVDEVHLTGLAEIVASAGFDPDVDVAAARRRIDRVRRPGAAGARR